MYLSRIVPTYPVADMGDYDLHQQVWRWFDPEQKGGNNRTFLFRRENSGRQMTIYTLSDQPPVVRDGWLADTKEFAPPMQAGQKVRFKARLNPTTKDDSGKRRALAAENLTEWLMRRLECIGAQLQTVAVEERSVAFQKARTGHDVTLGVVEVAGTLTVQDPARFLTGLREGVGRAKSFGCGLLMIRPV